MKKIIAVLSIQNFIMGQIQVPSQDGLDLFNSMMRYLISRCEAEFTTIGFWGGDRIFQADKAGLILANTSEVFRETTARRIKFLVVTVDEFYVDMPYIALYKNYPTLAIETMFVFHKSSFNQTLMFKMFRWFHVKSENSKFYYCTATEGKIDLVTFNAYADFAPSFWTKLASFIYRGKVRVQHWTLFKTQYSEESKFNSGADLCENLFFDRTKIMNGYVVRGAMSVVNNTRSNFTILNTLITKDSTISEASRQMDHFEFLTSQILTKYLNFSILITFDMSSTGKIDFDKLSSHTYDLSMTTVVPVAPDALPGLSTYFYLTYPCSFLYDVIMIHNRGLASPLEKMFEFYGWLTIIATFIIILITLIVIHSSNRTSSRSSFAAFECLRLLINNSLYTRMDSFKTRMFFSMIFLYFLVIQATFSGHLAAFLTKPRYRKNAEILEDLKDPRYTAIYARRGLQNFIQDPELLNKTTFGEFLCEKYIDDVSVACIDTEAYLNLSKVIYNLHTVKNYRTFMYTFLMLRYNWPLRYRVNNMIMRISHSGIYDFWIRIGRSHLEPKLKALQDVPNNYYRCIELEDVKFAFCLLGIGLVSAIICFAMEHAILYWKKSTPSFSCLKNNVCYVPRCFK